MHTRYFYVLYYTQLNSSRTLNRNGRTRENEYNEQMGIHSNAAGLIGKWQRLFTIRFCSCYFGLPTVENSITWMRCWAACALYLRMNFVEMVSKFEHALCSITFKWNSFGLITLFELLQIYMRLQLHRDNVTSNPLETRGKKLDRLTYGNVVRWNCVWM